jgi:hypothetical protein
MVRSHIHSARALAAFPSKTTAVAPSEVRRSSPALRAVALALRGGVRLRSDPVDSSESWPDYGNGLAESLAVDPSTGVVFVAGVNAGSTLAEDDYATVAYNPKTGAQLWVSRYSGPGNGLDEALWPARAGRPCSNPAG